MERYILLLDLVQKFPFSLVIPSPVLMCNGYVRLFFLPLLQPYELKLLKMFSGFKIFLRFAQFLCFFKSFIHLLQLPFYLFNFMDQ